MTKVRRHTAGGISTETARELRAERNAAIRLLLSGHGKPSARRKLIALVLDVNELLATDFDLSTADGRYIRPRCSQCEVLVINGVACHETGCRNETHECRGCNAMVPARVRFCEECAL